VSNVSHSPIRLLEEIGRAYKASGRALPIADDVSLHCYPAQNTDAPSVGFAWPNIGCVNLDRFKQAWWDVFNGTGQPVFQEAGQGPGRYVRAFIDESGYQAAIPADKADVYTGTENVPTISDVQQGQFYAQLVAWAACDPDVAELNIFHLIDEGDLAAMQTGLELADGTHRASYDLVKQALAANRTCQGTPDAWQHTTHVVGATFRKAGRSFLVNAAEGYSYSVSIRRATRTLAALSGSGMPNVDLQLKLPRLKHGTYRLTVRLTAETNPDRVTTFSKKFRV
jgi:hypothetical protein